MNNSNFNSPTFLENNRNELLKTDLEVMRVKLMEEITQKSRICQELDELKKAHH